MNQQPTLPTTSEGLEPVTKINYGDRTTIEQLSPIVVDKKLSEFGLKRVDLPKEADKLHLFEVIDVIKDALEEALSVLNKLERLLVWLKILDPLPKEDKIEAIKDYALNKK